MSVHSVVIVREVWDTRDLVGQVLDDQGEVLADQFATRLEPQDLNALEAALRIKDDLDGCVDLRVFAFQDITQQESRAVSVKFCCIDRHAQRFGNRNRRHG